MKFNETSVFEKNIEYEIKDNLVTVFMKHRGFFARIAQKFFKKPKISRIKLDENGSYVFLNIDGMKTLKELKRDISKDKPEILGMDSERFYKFINTLYNNHFIRIKK